MGVMCYVCRKVNYNNPQLSFHRFPAHRNRCMLWFKILGIAEDTKLPKLSVLCSDHFYPEDFFTTPTGKTYLYKQAVPSRHTESSRGHNCHNPPVFTLSNTSKKSSEKSNEPEEVSLTPPEKRRHCNTSEKDESETKEQLVEDLQKSSEDKSLKVFRRTKCLQNTNDFSYLSENHFEHPLFKSAGMDASRKLQPNAVSTNSNVSKLPSLINPPARKSVDETTAAPHKLIKLEIMDFNVNNDLDRDLSNSCAELGPVGSADETDATITNTPEEMGFLRQEVKLLQQRGTDLHKENEQLKLENDKLRKHIEGINESKSKIRLLQ